MVSMIKLKHYSHFNYLIVFFCGDGVNFMFPSDSMEVVDIGEQSPLQQLDDKYNAISTCYWYVVIYICLYLYICIYI